MNDTSTDGREERITILPPDPNACPDATPVGQAQEFGKFLQSRRARINPRQAGFPVGARRRLPGLRREEVAVLAGLSPTWYTYLEQGRKVRPSQAVLDSLARVLRLTEEERHYIHVLALGHPPGPPMEIPRPAPQDLWEVIDVIGNSKWPVYIANRCTDVLAWNQAFSTYYADFHTFRPESRSMVNWLFTDPAARKRIVGWEKDARDVVARLRSAYAVRAQDPAFVQRVRALTAASADFARWWSEREVIGQQTRDRTFDVPGLGVQKFHLTALHLADDEFTSVIVHIPAST